MTLHVCELVRERVSERMNELEKERDNVIHQNYFSFKKH